ncbi:MAG: Na+/H+ antiporter subunit E [Sphingobacteriales bacterium]|nr:MAG: Na+/H+ antiporter subunit E [Sphingobacteriales bacterium]
MTNQLFTNIMLTLIWVMLSGNTSIPNFGFGFVLGFVILYLTVRGIDNRRYFYRVPRMVRFILRYIYEMLKANLQVTRTILMRKMDVAPAIIKYPLEAKTDFEITMLSNIISLTPGTLVLDISDDKKVMYIHTLYYKDKDSFIKYIRLNLEIKLLEVIR